MKRTGLSTLGMNEAGLWVNNPRVIIALVAYLRSVVGRLAMVSV